MFTSETFEHLEPLINMFHFGLKGDIQLNKPQQLNFELIYRFNIIATTEHNIHQLLCVQS